MGIPATSDLGGGKGFGRGALPSRDAEGREGSHMRQRHMRDRRKANRRLGRLQDGMQGGLLPRVHAMPNCRRHRQRHRVQREGGVLCDDGAVLVLQRPLRGGLREVHPRMGDAQRDLRVPEPGKGRGRRGGRPNCVARLHPHLGPGRGRRLRHRHCRLHGHREEAEEEVLRERGGAGPGRRRPISLPGLRRHPVKHGSAPEQQRGRGPPRRQQSVHDMHESS
mmetsp:Transcript_12586/g.29902  ORF Transcript_12586/g.29902 Transcript_12586/m.29902 type:complete len:222 (+) Transcript_12586:1954-2619(+)